MGDLLAGDKKIEVIIKITGPSKSGKSLFASILHIELEKYGINVISNQNQNYTAELNGSLKNLAKKNLHVEIREISTSKHQIDARIKKMELPFPFYLSREGRSRNRAIEIAEKQDAISQAK